MWKISPNHAIFAFAIHSDLDWKCFVIISLDYALFAPSKAGAEEPKLLNASDV
jgi:hypothetical protein